MNAKRFCTSCGSELQPGASNCTNCGAAAPPAPADTAAPPAPEIAVPPAPEFAAPPSGMAPPPPPPPSAPPAPPVQPPPPPPGGWHQPPRQPSPISEYFRGLVDFKFTELFTTKLVGITYAGLLAFNALYALGLLILAFRTESAGVILFALVLCPAFVLLSLATWKLAFEMYVVLTRVLDASNDQAALLRRMVERDED